MPTFPGQIKPTGFPLGAGVIYAGDPDHPTPIGVGASEGGLKFTPATEYFFPPFDGAVSEIEGMHAVVDYSKAVLAGQIMDLSAASLMMYNPGASSDGSTGTNTITLIDGMTFLAAGTYLENLAFYILNSNGGVDYLFAERALIKKWDLQTKNKAEGLASIEITPVLTSTETNLYKCPYVWKVATS